MASATASTDAAQPVPSSAALALAPRLPNLTGAVAGGMPCSLSEHAALVKLLRARDAVRGASAPAGGVGARGSDSAAAAEALASAASAATASPLEASAAAAAVPANITAMFAAAGASDAVAISSRAAASGADGGGARARDPVALRVEHARTQLSLLVRRSNNLLAGFGEARSNLTVTDRVAHREAAWAFACEYGGARGPMPPEPVQDDSARTRSSRPRRTMAA